MSTPAAVLPDVVALTRNWLLRQPAVTDLVGQRVYTIIPRSPTFPLVVLQRTGGRPQKREWIDAAVIDVTCYADPNSVVIDPEEQASLITRTVRAAIHQAPGWHDAEGVITDVEDVLGMTWHPDTALDPPRPSFVFSVRITAHP